ncbi:MAG: GAF domain-containing protein [Ardenticatenaceae bacterium]|nr:GAF domain-containing protein [Ardenticatenaceae bacterium]
MKRLTFLLPQKRLLTYAIIFILLAGIRFFLWPNTWQGTLERHTIMEFMSAMLALFIGVLALVRYYTKKDNVFLFLGSGFVGAGLLDGYHALLANADWQQLLPAISAWESRWNWNTSSTFLSILIFGSWLTWRREKETGWYGRMNSRHLFGLIVGLTLLNTLLFLLVPVAAPAPDPYRLGRLELFISTTFYLWATVSYLAKGHWQHNTFEHWLVVSLLINFSGHAFYLAFSQTLFDALFEMSHILKQISYLSVLTGLLISMYSIFKQAEQDSAVLQQTNKALQKEIEERRRAETAEHEQRQLAEALREVGMALAATLDFDDLLDRLLDQIARVLPYDTAIVMSIDGSRIHVVRTRGYQQHQVSSPLSKTLTIPEIPSLRQMYETKKPLVIADTAVHPDWVRAKASPHVRSWAGTPITLRDEVIAFLSLNHSQPNFYQPDDALRLSAFAGQASSAIQNVRLYHDLHKHVEDLTSLYDISQAITSSLDLQAILAIITEHTTQLLNSAATSLVLLDRERGDLFFAAASGEAADFIRGKRLPLGEGVMGWVVEHGRPLLITNAQQDERHYSGFDQSSGFQATSLLCVPLQTKGRTIGAIEALNKNEGPFDESDQRLLTLLAIPVATAIENAQLFEKARREIRERQRAEEELAAERELLAQRVAERTTDLSAANAELARAARLKDEFLASMSHELRTPLNAILGISEALQEEIFGSLSEKQKQGLQSIEESGRHLLALINDILDLSKIEAGKLSLTINPVEVKSVSEASLRFIKQDALHKHLSVESDYDPQVHTIPADERRLKQILVNLLSNAVKFTPAGHRIGLAVKGDAAANLVHFTVWDTGIGIAPENVEKLFRPFVQLDSRLAREYSGTGLGLSLVYRMTKMHGGDVSLESEPGRGSRFTISLPWQGETTAVSPTPAHTHTPPLLDKTNGRPHNYHILLAEDNDVARSFLTDYLEDSGYQVTSARNGQEALARAQQNPPDIILMDIQMPGMDGLEAIRQLRTEYTTATIPIIALTALAMPGDEDRCLQAGANSYLSKPVRLAQLLEAIETNIIQSPITTQNP